MWGGGEEKGVGLEREGFTRSIAPGLVGFLCFKDGHGRLLRSCSEQKQVGGEEAEGVGVVPACIISFGGPGERKRAEADYCCPVFPLFYH